MDKLRMQTANKADENFRKLAAMFPNAVTETINENGEVVRAIDKDVLMQEISCTVVDGNEERYQFTWPDKKKSVLLANAPINKTLRPCREESVDFDTTENLYIEGDNLEVLKLLQETYLGKIKMIYIDPPYNTGHDFVYEDDFAQSTDEYLANSGQFDEEGNRMVQNTESNGRFHTDWLNMMYPRLRLAKDLLADNGVIFISIDNRENANLRKICNEVFGERCFITDAIWRSSDNSNNDAKQFSNDYNSTLVYSKNPLWQPEKQSDDEKRKHFKNPDNDPKGPYFDGNPLNSPNFRENLCYDIVSPQGITIHPPKNGWRWSKETLTEKLETGEIRFTEDGKNIRRRTYLCDMEGLPPSNLWIDFDKTGHNRQAKYELLKLLPEDVFDTPKPVKLMLHKVVCGDFKGLLHALTDRNRRNDHNILAPAVLLVQLEHRLDIDIGFARAGFHFNIKAATPQVFDKGSRELDVVLTLQGLNVVQKLLIRKLYRFILVAGIIQRIDDFKLLIGHTEGHLIRLRFDLAPVTDIADLVVKALSLKDTHNGINRIGLVLLYFEIKFHSAHPLCWGFLS